MIHMYTLSSSCMVDLWVNLDKRFQESFTQLYICFLVIIKQNNNNNNHIRYYSNHYLNNKNTIQILTNSKNQLRKRKFHFLPKDIVSFYRKTSCTLREIGLITVLVVPALYDGFQNFQAHRFQPISSLTFFL